MSNFSVLIDNCHLLPFQTRGCRIIFVGRAQPSPPSVSNREHFHRIVVETTSIRKEKKNQTSPKL